MNSNAEREIERERERERERARPSFVALSSIASPALLLILGVLEVSPPLNFLNDAGSHHLSPEPVEQPLLRLVLVNNYLHIVS